MNMKYKVTEKLICAMIKLDVWILFYLAEG